MNCTYLKTHSISNLKGYLWVQKRIFMNLCLIEPKETGGISMEGESYYSYNTLTGFLTFSGPIPLLGGITEDCLYLRDTEVVNKLDAHFDNLINRSVPINLGNRMDESFSGVIEESGRYQPLDSDDPDYYLTDDDF